MIIYCNYKNGKGLGANLSYYDNSRLLSEQGNALGLSFEDILRHIKDFRDEDILLVNSPYAWIFHCLREKYDQNFTIIRDVHTTFWSGYLLQEELCSKYSNDNDKLIMPSEFTRQFYIKSFPHLNEKNTSVCAPVMHFFPNKQEIHERKDDGELVLGWLGALSKEKNFDQALQIFIEASKSLKGRNIKFLVCGKPQSDYYYNKVIPLLNKQNIELKNYVHINRGKAIEHGNIWEFLGKINVMLFPSTANIESCPRVLLEANHAEIPIIASEHGGGYNVVPKDNLVKTTYFDRTSDLINNQPLGKIDIAEAVEKIADLHKLKLNNDLIYKDHAQKLLAIVNNKKTEEEVVLDNRTRAFINNTKLFISKNYTQDINKAIRILLNNNPNDIGSTAYKIARGLRFNVYAKIFSSN
ncbi:MAG: glycosyltransferase family 4 protein [Nanoarchaeota archaeon]|nr:glycosyltransferase family 4 protein [Nanoarchaeota archaeon]